MRFFYLPFLVIVFSITLFSSTAYSQCNPVITITRGVTDTCGPHSIFFNSEQSSGISSVLWDFGDSTTAASNPLYIFHGGTNGNDSTYTVTLYGTCVDTSIGIVTDVITINAWQVPKINFTSETDIACQINDEVCFTNLTNNSLISSYQWNFGQGEGNSSEQNPCYRFSLTGNKDIRLSATTNKGCKSEITKEKLLNIIGLPSPSFNIDKQKGCNPVTVNVTNTTTDMSSITEWLWTWGDNDSSFSKQPPSHLYEEVDIFQVKLKATSSTGCYNTSNGSVEVKQTPVAKVLADRQICLNDQANIRFDTTTYPGANYSWSFDTTSSSTGSNEGPYSVEWDISGYKIIEVTTNLEGCIAKDTASVFVLPQPVVLLELSTSNDTICEGDSVTFTANPSNYSKYIFYVNGINVQESESNQYTARNIISTDAIFVDARDINNCASKIIGDTVQLNVISRPVVTLTNLTGTSDSICNGDTIHFEATPTGYNKYSFIDGYKTIQSDSTNQLTYSNSLKNGFIKVLAEHQGCGSDTSNPLSYFKAVIIEPLDSPVVNCGKTTINSIEFFWDELPRALGYEISINDSAWFTPSDTTSHLLTGLAENQEVSIKVKANGANPCGDSPITITPTTCKTIECDKIDFIKPKDQSVCVDEEVSLIIDSITISNSFVYWNNNLSDSGTYYQHNAVDSSSIKVSVKNMEKPDCPIVSKHISISVIDPIINLTNSSTGDSICNGELITFNASPEGYDNYLFYDNWKKVQHSPMSSYNTDKLKNDHFITVKVAIEECIKSSEDTAFIEVVDPTPAPIVNCGKTSPNSIEFIWDSIAGINEYQISYDGSSFYSPTSLFSQLDTGLAEGQAVTVMVRAISYNPCGNSSLSLSKTCFAEICDEIDFSHIPEISACKGDSIPLSIQEISIPAFSISWNGEALTKEISSTHFASKSENIFVSVINDEQLACIATTKYFDLTVNEIPSVAISSFVSLDSICEFDTISFTASPPGYELYEFYDRHKLIQESGNHEFIGSGFTDNLHKITVKATNNECVDYAIDTILVASIPALNIPQVNCGKSTTNSTTFFWDPVPYALGYEISINDSNYTSPSGTLEHFINLPSDSSATISVIALGMGPCGNSRPSSHWKGKPKTCYSKACQQFNFTRPNDENICLGDSSNLVISNITTNNYSISWDGSPFSTDINYRTQFNISDTISIELEDLSQAQCPNITKYVVIEIKPIPTTQLISSADSICKGEEITFTAQPDGYDDYEFYDNWRRAQTGTGNTYTTNNLKDNHFITVKASIKECSQISDDTIRVEVISPTPTPVINCGKTTPNSVEFIWDSISGVNEFLISYDSIHFFSSTTMFSQIDTGLIEGQSVSIVIKAINNGPCGNSNLSAPKTCSAIICEEIDFTNTPTATACKGDSIELTVNEINIPSYSVSWNGSPYISQSKKKFYALIDEEISVSVSNNNQVDCPVSTKYFNLTVHDIPTVNISSVITSDSICDFDTLSFTASPPGYDLYEFYDKHKIIQSTGNHIYIGSDFTTNLHQITVKATENGCSDFADDTIEVASLPPLDVPQVNCGKSTTNSITFFWDPVPYALGYEVSVNDSIYITPNGNFEHFINYPSDSSATISVIALGLGPCGNSSPSSSWENKPKTCYSKACEKVDFIRPNDESICYGDSSHLNISNIIATSPSISWRNNTYSTNTKHDTLFLDSDTISINIKDINQPLCPSITKYVTIEVKPIPIAQTSSSKDTICEGDSVSFAVNPANFDSYVFYSGNILMQDSTSNYFSFPLLTQDSSAHITTWNNGCSYKTDTISIAVIATPQLSSSSTTNNDTICSGDDFSVTLSPDNYSYYNFYNGNSIIQSSTKNQYNLDSINVTDSVYVNNFYAEAINSYGCLSNQTKVMPVTILPVIFPSLTSSSDTVCFGASMTYYANPDTFISYSYYLHDSDSIFTLMQDSSSNSFTTEIHDFVNRVYVYGVDKNGCRNESNFKKVKVKEISNPKIMTNDNSICTGDTIVLTGNVDSVYQNGVFNWSTNQNGVAILVHPTTSTKYFLSHTYKQCESFKDTINIYVDTVFPDVDAGVNRKICINSSVQLNASGGNTYIWTPDTLITDNTIQDPTVSPMETTVYTVMATNISCTATDNVQIEVDLCLNDITGEIPQIITPNGDDVNDKWIIPDIDYFTSNSLKIFNRWGSVVYSTDYYQNDWKGLSSSGKELIAGTYYYILDLGIGNEPYTGYIIIHR